jgi:very-short-patch-repair endonuclease
LRAPLYNPALYDGKVFLGKPDAWWPRAGVVVEIDSRAWHLSPEDWDRTRYRHDRMAAVGIIVLHFSPRDLRRQPGLVTKQIRDALAKGLGRPSLPIRTIPVQ